MAGFPNRLEPWTIHCAGLAPSEEELSAMIGDLRRHLGGMERVCRLTGLQPGTLCGVAYAGKGSHPTMRAIWLAWQAVLRPGQVNSIFHWETWGRYTASAGPQHAGKLLPNSKGDAFMRRYLKPGQAGYVAIDESDDKQPFLDHGLDI